MAIAEVQKASAGATAQDHVDVVLGGAPTPGNVLIGVMFTRAADAFPPTGFSTVQTVNNATEADQAIVCVREVESGDGATHRFTATAAAGESHAAGLFEFSGLLDTVDESDQTGRTAGVTSLSAGSVTTALSNLLAVAFIAIRGTPTGPSWNNSFADAFGVVTGGTASLIAATKIISGSGVVTTTASWTTALTVMGGIVTFGASEVRRYLLMRR